VAGNLRQGELNQPVTRHAKGDFIALKQRWTVGEALESLRGRALGEKIVYFYVTDDDGKLVGVVPTRRLLMSQTAQPLADIMVQPVISIPDSMTVVDACEYFVLYRMLAFPVVDPGRKLVGVIDVSLFTDEVLGLSQAQATKAAEDVFQLIGVRLARARGASPWASFRSRFPWLLSNIAGGLACAFLMGMHERFLDSMIVLAMFVPVVLALSESVSMQSMSITLHGLRAGRIEWRILLRSLGVEMATSVLLGAACGLTVGLVAWAWKRHAAVAVAIAASICLAIMTSCLLGVLLPTLIRAFRGNPRIAAGPLVLALADVATLLFYFALSGMILG
jgi:magnesium transporter